ncbi:phosphoadenosine phosphosulfate reductase family protein [Eubacteriales bacterium OttesenSCG-928-G02]|nr:phosphoadenosine phosphosulfate reductase family protein [Eubacteriales bacterium OttesenSCG-928-G02]
MNTNKEYKYTVEDYRKLSKEPLERKIQIAQTRILETFIEAQKANQEVVCSFSGGIDSTVMLHLVRMIKPDCKAVFIDTGMEIPSVKRFALSFDNVEIIRPQYCKVCTGCELGCYGRVNSEKGFVYPNKADSRIAKGVVERHIKKGNIAKANTILKLINEREQLQADYPQIKFSNECCNVLKKNTVKRYIKENNIFAQFVGVKAHESIYRYHSWRLYGCNSFEKNASRPLSIWNNQDTLRYIREFNLPYCKEWYGEQIPNKSGGYKWSNIQRSGCYGCVIGFTDEFDEVQDIKENEPELYEYLQTIPGYMELYNYTKAGRKYY